MPKSLPPPPVKKLPSRLKDLAKHVVEKAEDIIVQAGDLGSGETEIEITDVSDLQNDIDRLVKASTYEPDMKYWLDTGDVDMNTALGSKKYGLPYGKVIELRGPEHGGKTTLTTVLAGIAQKEGAGVGYIDLENSRDKPWARKLGLDLDKVFVIAPRLLPGEFKKKKRDRMESAEVLFDRAELAMQIMRERGIKKQFWFLDSVANITTEMAEEAGTTGRNMRVNIDRAQFLSQVLPRWAGLAMNYNAMIVLINQLRTKIGVVFGNPEYSAGGRALAHACAIRADIRRYKKGEILQNGRVVGVIGKVKNFKNKAGKGSVQNHQAAFKIKWVQDPAKITFMPIEEAEG